MNHIYVNMQSTSIRVSLDTYTLIKSTEVTEQQPSRNKGYSWCQLYIGWDHGPLNAIQDSDAIESYSLDICIWISTIYEQVGVNHIYTLN